MSIEDKFNIENLYKDYLQASGLNEKDMNDREKSERRKSFYAGAGIVLRLLLSDIPQMPEQRAVRFLDNMYEQVLEFMKTGEVRNG